MIGILNKVITGRFYKVNAGFFLLLIMLFFGIIPGKQAIDLQYAIMQAITGSYAFLGVAMLVWLAYNIKCISFFLKEIHMPENSFLVNLQALDNKTQFLTLLECQAGLYMPSLVYSMFTAMVGFKNHFYPQAFLVILFQLLMVLVGTLVYTNSINSTYKKPLINLPPLNFFNKKSYPFYLLHYSLQNKKGTFIGIKFFSLLLLQAMVAANADKLSKEAICVLIMFLISAHSLLPVSYVSFMEYELGFLRNLPIPTLRRFSVFILTYALIFLPELLFLLWNAHEVLPLQIILSLYALAITQMCLYTSLLYLKKMKSERYTFIVFGLFFLSLLLLASTNLWVLAAIEAIVSTILYTYLYNQFELPGEKKE